MSAWVSRVRAFWREIEPGLLVDRNNFIERWDGRGEGRAIAVGFEGFGVTLQLFFGRTPRADRQPHAGEEK